MVNENSVPFIDWQYCGCTTYLVIDRICDIDPQDPNQVLEYYLVECNHLQRHWLDRLTLLESLEEST